MTYINYFRSPCLRESYISVSNLTHITLKSARLECTQQAHETCESLVLGTYLCSWAALTRTQGRSINSRCTSLFSQLARS
jgi:hypothetical protein